MKELGIATNIEAYIQAQVLKTTLEAISFEYRRDHLSEVGGEQVLQSKSDLGKEIAGDMQELTSVQG